MSIREEAVISEFPYRHGWGLLAFLAILSVFFLIASLFLLAEDGPIDVEGQQVEGASAVFFKILAIAYSVGLSAVTARLLWIRARFPNQRIAFVEDGILLPPNRFSITEAFVPFDRINESGFDYHHNDPSFLSFRTYERKFSISQQKLTKEAFHEICGRLRDGIQHARYDSAAPLDVESVETEMWDPQQELLLHERSCLCYFRLLMTVFCSIVGIILVVVLFFGAINPDIRENKVGMYSLCILFSLLSLLCFCVRHFVGNELKRVDARFAQTAHSYSELKRT